MQRTGGTGGSYGPGWNDSDSIGLVMEFINTFILNLREVATRTNVYHS